MAETLEDTEGDLELVFEPDDVLDQYLASFELGALSDNEAEAAAACPGPSNGVVPAAIARCPSPSGGGAPPELQSQDTPVLGYPASTQGASHIHHHHPLGRGPAEAQYPGSASGPSYALQDPTTLAGAPGAPTLPNAAQGAWPAGDAPVNGTGTNPGAIAAAAAGDTGALAAAVPVADSVGSIMPSWGPGGGGSGLMSPAPGPEFQNGSHYLGMDGNAFSDMPGVNMLHSGHITYSQQAQQLLLDNDGGHYQQEVPRLAPAQQQGLQGAHAPFPPGLALARSAALQQAQQTQQQPEAQLYQQWAAPQVPFWHPGMLPMGPPGAASPGPAAAAAAAEAVAAAVAAIAAEAEAAAAAAAAGPIPSAPDPGSAAALLRALGATVPTGPHLLALLELLTGTRGLASPAAAQCLLSAYGPAGGQPSGQAGNSGAPRRRQQQQPDLPSSSWLPSRKKVWGELEQQLAGQQYGAAGAAAVAGVSAGIAVHTALPYELLKSVLQGPRGGGQRAATLAASSAGAAGPAACAAGSAAAGGGGGGGAAPCVEWLGPQELQRPHFMEQTGGYGKCQFERVSEPTEGANSAQRGVAAVPPSGSLLAAPPGRHPAACPSGEAGAIEPGAWYVCNYENNTHCLEHHGVKKCSSNGHQTHQVHKRMLMFCLGASAPEQAPQQKKQQRRERKKVDEDGGGKLYRIKFRVEDTEQEVTMLFGTTWPAWYTALPPGSDQAARGKRRNNIAQQPQPLPLPQPDDVVDVATDGDDSRGAAPADAGLLAERRTAARRASSAGAGAAASAGAASGTSGGTSVGSNAAAGTGAAGAALGGPGGSPAAGQSGPEAAPGASGDADLAQSAIRLCLLPNASVSHWRVFLGEDLLGPDGRPDVCRLMAIRDGNDPGFGLLNIILNKVVELLGLKAGEVYGGLPASFSSWLPSAVADWKTRKAALEERVVEMLSLLFDEYWWSDPRVSKKLLLQHDRDWQDTALHTCCRYDLRRVLGWLLPRCDAEVLTAPTKSGWPPSTSACRAGNQAAAAACLATLKQLGVMGDKRYLKVLLADLTHFNKYYDRFEGRRVLEAAIAEVWPDPATRPRVHQEVGREAELVELQNQLANMQLVSRTT